MKEKTARNNSHWLVTAIIVLLPTYLLRFNVWGWRFNFLDVVIAIALVICLWRYRTWPIGKWRWPMLIFLLIGLVAVLVAPDRLAALGLYKSLMVMPVLVGLIVLMTRPPVERVVRAGAYLVSYLAVIALIQYFSGGVGVLPPWNMVGENFRVTSVFEYPNAVGLLLAPLVTMLLVNFVSGQKRSWLLFGASLLGIAGIIVSRSDGAMVAVAMALIITLLFTRWRWLALIFGISGIMIALAYPVSREILLFQDTSGEVRLALWQGTWNLLREHFWLGAGLGGFPVLYAQYKLARHVELLLYPHNLFLDFWVELGLVGLFWLVTQLGWFFIKMWRLRTSSPEVLTLLSAMLVIIVYGLVDVTYFKNDLAVVFWVVLTMTATLKKHS